MIFEDILKDDDKVFQLIDNILFEDIEMKDAIISTFEGFNNNSPFLFKDEKLIQSLIEFNNNNNNNNNCIDMMTEEEYNEMKELVIRSNPCTPLFPSKSPKVFSLNTDMKYQQQAYHLNNSQSTENKKMNEMNAEEDETIIFEPLKTTKKVTKEPMLIHLGEEYNKLNTTTTIIPCVNCTSKKVQLPIIPHLDATLDFPMKTLKCNFAVKPSNFLKYGKVMNDNSEQAIFYLDICLKNCKFNLNENDFKLMLISEFGKENCHDGELINVQMVTPKTKRNETFYHLDKENNEQILLVKSISKEGEKLRVACQITTSNNHSCWSVKHFFYRILIFSNKDGVHSALTPKFQVTKSCLKKTTTKTAAISKQHTPTITMKEKRVTEEVILIIDDKKRKVNLGQPVTFEVAKKKYKATLTLVDDEMNN
ncbi:hypothetical protein ABK040_016297 [Willaertia magna]